MRNVQEQLHALTRHTLGRPPLHYKPDWLGLEAWAGWDVAQESRRIARAELEAMRTASTRMSREAIALCLHTLGVDP